MIRLMTTLVFGLSFIGILPPARLAAAVHPVPAIGSADGMDTTPGEFDPDTGEGEVEWVAEGTGTVIGHHMTLGITRFNVFTGESSGEFFSWSLDDPETTLYGTFTGAFKVIPGTAFVRSTLKLNWEYGTGLLEGVSGTATSSGPPDDDTDIFFHYEYNGYFSFDD
jgi:hypothetical protein